MEPTDRPFDPQLVAWGRGAQVDLPPGGLAEAFARQVAATPDAVALVDGDRQVSFGRLAAEAHRVAHRLARLGVGPEVGVGVCAERSLELVVAILGAVEAGGFYVPLDPSHPAERLVFVFEDVHLAAVVGTAAALAALPPHGAVPLALDAERASLAAQPANRPQVAIDPEHLVYVLYTSGSSGRPKGVAVTHRNVLRLVWRPDWVRLGPQEVFLQAAPVAFDASTFELWAPLLHGGRLVLHPPGPPSPGELGRLLARHGVSTLWLTAGLLHQVVDADLAGLAPVGQLLAGGDVLSPGHVSRVLAAHPRTVVVNGYGPTENTTFTACGEVGSPQQSSVPIGRPVAGSTVWLAGERAETVAVGEEGELWTGGLGVARGYAGRPAATAERFVPDPLAGVPGSGVPAGARAYRTGDRARWRTDGRLEFLGRRDAQVKIRGFRVEPGEVEAVLAAHPGVGSVVVVAREDVPGDRRLVAYVVPEAGRSRPAALELRARAAAHLPEAMVPAAVVLLDALPLTANGKVDRRALPAPGGERPELSVPYRPPAPGLEAEAAGLFAQFLGLDPGAVGADDDLFELGGHSLVATQLAVRLARLAGRDCPLAAVFSQPTPAGLAALLAAGGPAQAALPPLRPAPRDRPIPVSYPQEQIWFLHKLAPAAIAYNFQFTLRLAGALDPARWRAALAAIVERHEILRTTFPEHRGAPVQVVHPSWPVALPLVDFSGLPAARREAESEARVADFVRRPFRLERLPLLRFVLLRLDARDHVHLQVEHHFVHDGWSIAVFLDELKALYAAACAGRPSPLPPLPAQYADYVAWQRGELAAEVFPRQLKHWRRRLAHKPPPLAYPPDRPRGAQQTFRGAMLRVDLPPELAVAVREFSHRRGGTLFATAFAAFAALGARWTGLGEFLVGSGVAARRLPELEKLMGMVVNTLVLPADASADPTGSELLARVRAEAAAAQDHQDLPFEVLVADLDPQRDLSRNPLFQILFSFHDAPVPDLAFADLAGTLRERHNGSAKVDLNVVVKPRAEQRVGRRPDAEDATTTLFWEYDRDLYDRATVERLWRQYATLLAGLVADPERRISELPLLSAGERATVVAAWNDTAVEWPEVAPVPVRVARQALARPAAPAVESGGRTLTYGELHRRAVALAGRLEVLGIGRGASEARVAVLLPRSAELVVAQLAALYAGAAYVPLDPSHPAERLAATVADAGPAALITARTPAPRRFALPRGVPVVELDLAGEPEDTAEAGVPAAVESERLAYVIYTSGSTGTPKGVTVPHRGLANLVDWHLAACGLGPGDRVSLVAGLAFDASVLELWPTLAAGACLAIPDEEVRAEPERLVPWLAQAGVTVAFLPTPVAERALALPWPAETKVRRLLTGGAKLHARPPTGLPFVLVDHYGPTEFSVVTTSTEVAPSGPGRLRPTDLGRPIANARTYVLDRRLAPLPPGAVGALWVAGDGIARGYHGQPGMTADRFRPDPFSPAPGGRLYATGDLARHLADGRLEFHGRADRQVKVRGFRVEPGEVEAALLAVPGIAGAAVGTAVDPVGETVLAAWWVAAAGSADLDAGALRSALAARVPGPMVPARFVALDRLPLTANGKVDFEALPAPDWSDHGGGEYLPPAGEVEELVAEVWREVLGRERIGRGDHFFDLGGHSLSATRTVARLRDLLAEDVPLHAVFNRPVLADFAGWLEERMLAAEFTSPAGPGTGPGSPPGS